MKVTILQKLPDDFFKATPNSLHQLIPDGTLICLAGKKTKPLFLSCLLHGNETSSFYSIQRLLKEFKELPRSLIIFFGNVSAAARGKRHLENQPDYNRIWSGNNSIQEKMAQEVIGFAKKQDLWASIDIHNNTGSNPYYACINGRDRSSLALASMFSNDIIYFEEPHSVQAIAFTRLCTSVTLECGKSGDQNGIDKIVAYLKQVLSLESFDHVELHTDQLTAFHTIAKIILPKHLNVDFNFSSQANCHISFLADLDKYNFKSINQGTALAKVSQPDCFLKVYDNSERDVTAHYLEEKSGEILVKKTFIPSMLTKDIFVAKDDCLGYIMQPIELHL